MLDSSRHQLLEVFCSIIYSVSGHWEPLATVRYSYTGVITTYGNDHMLMLTADIVWLTNSYASNDQSVSRYGTVQIYILYGFTMHVRL